MPGRNEQSQKLTLELVDAEGKPQALDDEGAYTVEVGKTATLKVTMPSTAPVSEEGYRVFAGSSLWSLTDVDVEVTLRGPANQSVKQVDLTFTPAQESTVFTAVSLTTGVGDSDPVTVRTLASSPVTVPDGTAQNVIEPSIGEYDEALTSRVFGFLGLVVTALLLGFAYLVSQLLGAPRQELVQWVGGQQTTIAIGGLLDDKVQSIAVGICSFGGLLLIAVGGGLAVMETRGRLRADRTKLTVPERLSRGGIEEVVGSIASLGEKLKNVRASLIVLVIGTLLLVISVAFSFRIEPWMLSQ